MSNYWPSGFDLKDTASPIEILNEARLEWHDRGDGVLNLLIMQQPNDRENCINVHALFVPSKRSISLFSVHHRKRAPYPVRIEPNIKNLPDELKKTYYKPGIAGGLLSGGVLAAALSEGHEVKNRWVCDTPSEFRSKLSDVFNLGSIKTEILSLVSGEPDKIELNSNEELASDSTGENEQGQQPEE